MAINVTDPQLKDLNLRLAIRYGIDVPSIIQAAFDDKWKRANAIIPQNMGLGYWKGAPAYARDVDKAKGYLAKSGLSNVTLTLACVDDEAEQDRLPGDPGEPQGRRYHHQPGRRRLGHVQRDPRRRRGWQESATRLRRLRHRARSLVVHRLVHVCAERPLELGQLVRQGRLRSDCTTPPSRRPTRPSARSLYVQLQKLWDAKASMVWIAYHDAVLRGSQGPDAGAAPDGHLIPYAFRAA